MCKKQTNSIKKSYIFCILFIFFSLAAYAADFSADMVITVSGQTTVSKVYIASNNMRIETEQGGEMTIMINDYKNRKIIILMPANKMYMEMPLQESDLNDPDYKKQIEALADKKSLGKETVNGYLCEKIQYIYHDKEYGSVTMWYSEELQYFIKMKAENMEMEFKNIKVGTVSQDLFTIPQGYSQMGGFGY